MGEEKNEMDQYGVPAISRPRYFAFKVFGGWGTAGIFCALLLRCWAARVTDEKARPVEYERIRKEARAEIMNDVKRELAPYFKHLERQEQKIDSVTNKVDTLDKSI